MQRHPIIILALMIAILSACATVNQLHEKYPGYTVVDKRVETKVKQEPLRIEQHILPNGLVVCEGVYGEGECVFPVAQFEARYRTRTRQIIIDTGRYKSVESQYYYLTLESPTGSRVEEDVLENQFNGVLIGQKLGRRS